MNRLLYFFFLLMPLAASAAPPITINDPFYTFQAGVSAGFTTASSPVNGKGYHLGSMGRWGHHTFGFRFDKETDRFGGFGLRTEIQHRKRGGYYGFTFGKEKFQWGPQMAIGQLEYDYVQKDGGRVVNARIERDTYFELSVYALGGARGNGFGARMFVLFSSIEKYVGFTIYVQAGWAWNNE
jgi:hypothetical protein